MADYRQESNVQFRVTYSQTDGTFRILNLYHPDIEHLPPDATIPDNTPALKTLSSLEVNSLLGKVNEMGWIDKIFGPREKTGVQNNAANSQIYSGTKTIQEIAIENITSVVQSDKDAGVTKEAIDAIRSLVLKTQLQNSPY